MRQGFGGSDFKLEITLLRLCLVPKNFGGKCERKKKEKRKSEVK